MNNCNKNLFFVTICLFGCINNLAQKGIAGLINAEKSFAAHSVAHSTKEAFLKYLDSAGIIFDNGKPVNGIETWNKREKRPGRLKWEPQFAEVSASKTFGYTTGPWTFQNDSNDTIVARGQYTTVWQFNSQSEWKFLIDLGVNNTPAAVISEIKIVGSAKQIFDTTTVLHTEPLLNVENRFLKLVSKNKSKTYNEYLSAESLLHRNGYLPALTPADQQKFIDITPASIQYKIEGAGISPFADMGYVYGKVVVHGKTDNYLRIWRREQGGWKIALEVLRF